jgi:hypothetical protein
MLMNKHQLDTLTNQLQKTKEKWIELKVLVKWIKEWESTYDSFVAQLTQKDKMHSK